MTQEDINIQEDIVLQEVLNISNKPNVVNNEDLNTQERSYKISNEISIQEIKTKLEVYLYRSILAPELQKNEEIKRKHKGELLKLTKQIIYFNFGIIISCVILCFIGIAFIDKINFNFCKEILSFLKYFLTSIFVEFISILCFIVHSVFDSSISNMFGSFREKK